MNRSKLKLIFAITATLLLSPKLLANTPVNAFESFPNSSLDGWKEKSFVGNTDYTLVEDNGATVLKASANKTASVLYKKQKINLNSTPWLEWSWKIESIYANIDEKTRDGDDFPARLYVTAQVGALPWDTIALNYVWSSKEPVDSTWDNPFTSKAKMVTVQSGQQLAGQWANQRRNIRNDFKEFFNVDVNQISGYAVMVDGDNASQTGTAYFGNIEFLAD